MASTIQPQNKRQLSFLASFKSKNEVPEANMYMTVKQTQASPSQLLAPCK